MSFLNTPLKSVQVNINLISGVESMPWYNPLLYPIVPPASPPAPLQKDFRWSVVMDVSVQQHSAYNTRDPGRYSSQDIVVGEWIANLSSGQAWQIISIESKNAAQVVATVQDVYRYNTFRDVAQVGNGSPAAGNYVVFGIGDTGAPEIDPVPAAGTSAQFSTNLFSRFEYINQQYNYPLYQLGNTFAFNDVIAVDHGTNSFVLATSTYKTVVGRITSISDTIPGWFTVNPVQKVVDFLDYLPGNVGDTIYASTAVPGGITVTPGGTELYIKLRNNTQSVSYSTLPGPGVVGNIFQLNGVELELLAPPTVQTLVILVNTNQVQTGVSAIEELLPTTVETSSLLISPTYGEPALYAISSPATATINGSQVTFNIASTDPGYTEYARAAEMAQSINNASISNIVASVPSALVLLLTNTAGGPITITNDTSDINGVPFAGNNSGSGLALLTSASSNFRIKFTADDARAINFLDVVGTPTGDFGLTSVENGIKACGLYIESGLRSAETTVLLDISALNTLQALIGDQAYVINSDDGNGNNVGEWSMWLWDGDKWVRTSTEDSSSTDAKSLEYTVTIGSPASIEIGKISTGRRVSLITVEVITPFNGTAPSLSIGYQVNNPVIPLPEIAGLMPSSIIDLTVAGTYTTYTDILFGTDTEQGDVTITAAFDGVGSANGEAQIIVSYV
jgi:hypothetical protein